MTDKKILLVEDNLINIKVAKLFLDECGYKNITVAKTGKEALKLFSPDFDLVLLDIGLPDIIGTEICYEFRKMLNGKSLPIIGYTAIGDITREDCIKAGMNDFLTKPARLSDFKAMLALYFGE